LLLLKLYAIFIFPFGITEQQKLPLIVFRYKEPAGPSAFFLPYVWFLAATRTHLHFAATCPPLLDAPWLPMFPAL
jgi:hypothetical protein